MRSAPVCVPLLVAVALLVAPTGCTSEDPLSADVTGSTIVEPNATVVRVIDGDTIVVDIGDHRETVRLIGIDTPETVRPDAPVECYGPEASAHTKDLLAPGTPIRLERDAEARDDYGRLLAYVVRATDGLFVNRSLVEGGFAQPMTFPTNTAHAGELVEAARTAERAGLGLWAACGG